MEEDVLKIIQGDEKLYPHNLEKRYSRVLREIVELWDTGDIDAYFLNLMVDTRGGRQGFPPEVAREIFVLSQVRERTRPPEEKPADPWATVGIGKQGEIEAMGFQCTPQGFLKCIENRNIKAAMLFLGSRVDVNVRDDRGWTPLTIAAFNGDEAIAELLIRSGADIHATDNAGYGPLHWAAFNGYARAVKLLIVKGADINGRSQHGWTPLLQAATRGHLGCCGALIASGADVNLASNDGWAPLHKASANGHTEVVRLLLSAGANPAPHYRDGTTPLQLAEKRKHHEIVTLLTATPIREAGTSSSPQPS